MERIFGFIKKNDTNILMKVLSFLNLWEMSSASLICKTFHDSFVDFFMNVDHNKNTEYRPKGISENEQLKLSNPKRTCCERMFELIIFSGLVKNYERIVSSIDLDDQAMSLLELSAYKGYKNSTLYLIRAGLYREKCLGYSLEYCGNNGNVSIVKELLKHNIGTQYVNRCLNRCLEKKKFDAAFLLLNDHRICFNFNHSSHIRKILRLRPNDRDEWINLKRKLEGEQKEALLLRIRKELMLELMKQKEMYNKAMKSIQKKKKKKNKSLSSSTFGSIFQSADSISCKKEPTLEQHLFSEMEKEAQKDLLEASKTEEEKAQEFRKRMERRYNIISHSYDKRNNKKNKRKKKKKDGFQILDDDDDGDEDDEDQEERNMGNALVMNRLEEELIPKKKKKRRRKHHSSSSYENQHLISSRTILWFVVVFPGVFLCCLFCSLNFLLGNLILMAALLFFVVKDSIMNT